LIGEQLATGRKRPDHAEQKRMHAVGFCKLHHQGNGCPQHGDLAGQQEMIEEGGPVHDYRRAQDPGHVGCHPGEHRLGENFQALGDLQYRAHAHGSGDEKHRQVVQPLHVLDIEDADPRQEREQPHAHADDGGGDMMKEIGEPEENGRCHEGGRAFLEGRPCPHLLHLRAQEFIAAVERDVFRWVEP
jgi:hypothetical protein